MTKFADCLIEIQTEELPPKSQRKLGEAFQQQITERLQKENLTFNSVQWFVTPRRLAALVTDLAGAQPDQVIERKGPALNAAYDKDGKPSKACEGFARSCGVSVDKLYKIKTDQGEWVGYRQEIKGKEVAEILPPLVWQSLSALPIARRMHWGASDVEFVRPVHSVMLMYGKKVIPAEILGCKSGNVTRGHRFMADKKIKISVSSDYERLLEMSGKVISDFMKRREMIREEVEKVIKELLGAKGNAIMTDDLLDEVTGLVEYPVAMCGKFDEEYLTVPKEVLISSMKDHQRYFPVVDAKGALLPYFVFISNIKSKKPQQVVHGNERVLRARLSDAKFFFTTDQQERLDARVNKLKDVVYQAKLGTLHDKAERLSKLTSHIAIGINVDKKQAERAGMLAKADLVTSMVGEFPELQGVMGGYYARHDGESRDIVDAMPEQYMPRFAGDALPESKLGAALALADRLDLLAGSFGINQIPTGDKDPYGLRRAALGVVRILIDLELNLDCKDLLKHAVNYYQADCKFENKDVIDQAMNFIRDRLRVWYLDQGVTADVFASVAALDINNLLDFHQRVLAVQSFKKLHAAEALAAANKRVSNILSRYQEKMHAEVINPAYFEELAETELANELELKNGEIARLCEEGRYNEVLLQLASLREPVDAFFDKVMVMTDDQVKRENRILLLMRLRNLFLQVADIALLQ